MEDSNVLWRKSTRCGSSACVEVAIDLTTVIVRDGKQLHNHDLVSVDKVGWMHFIGALKEGELGA